MCGFVCFAVVLKFASEYFTIDLKRIIVIKCDLERQRSDLNRYLYSRPLLSSVVSQTCPFSAVQVEGANTLL